MIRIFWDPAGYSKEMSVGGSYNVFTYKIEDNLIYIQARYKDGAMVKEDVVPCYVSTRYKVKPKGAFAISRISSNIWVIEQDCRKLSSKELELPRQALLLINVPEYVESDWLNTI